MNVACKKVNRFGRSYTPGTALSEECQSNIIEQNVVECRQKPCQFRALNVKVSLAKSETSLDKSVKFKK